MDEKEINNIFTCFLKYIIALFKSLFSFFQF